MKKGTLINAPASAVIAAMGHTDSLVVCDAGLPIPNEPTRIDLALSNGVPGFVETLAVICAELCVERVVMAEEIRDHNQVIHQKTIDLIGDVANQQGKPIEIGYVPHEQFKQQSESSRAVVRTGECTPYANILLFAGVTF